MMFLLPTLVAYSAFSYWIFFRRGWWAKALKQRPDTV
jgi:hypothetical protein